MISLKGRVCVLTQDVDYTKWQGHEAPPLKGTWPMGTKVKVVMESRFWDVGITDDLQSDSGYHARISPGILTWDEISPLEKSLLEDCHEMWKLQKAADLDALKRRQKNEEQT